MDFSDRIESVRKQILDRRDSVSTEEATKHAMIMPFIQSLGYDVFDPGEVVPEFTADIGEKRGERVDYAIMCDGAPAILFECKPFGATLSVDHAIQLQRYFNSLTPARFGVLTNGTTYLFFSDLDEKNIMDKKPFLEVHLEELDEGVINQLKKFCKANFDKEQILGTAGQLKYTKELRGIIERELTEPSDDFVKYLVSQVYDRRFTQNALDRFTPIVRKAIQQVVDSKINQTLERAKALQGEVAQAEEAADADAVELPEIITTQEELDGFNIVRAILAKDVLPERVAIRDCKSYCGILLDDNNRKPLCRLYFNSPNKKQVGFFGAGRQEERVSIEKVHDLYSFAGRLLQTLNMLEGGGPGAGQNA